MRRSNVLVLVGTVFFVLGAVVVFLIARDDDGGSPAAAPTTPEQVPVLVATGEIPAGTTGEDVIDQGLVEVQQVRPDQRLADALTFEGQLRNQLIARDIAPGEQLTTSHIRPRSLLPVELPEGTQALAIDLPFVNGGGGYVAPGDKINIYYIASNTGRTAGPLPRVELLLTNVTVLDVSQAIESQRTREDLSTPRESARTLTFLLAVDTDDAERLILAKTFDALYFTVVPVDAPPSPNTPGIDLDSILGTDPAAEAAEIPAR